MLAIVMLLLLPLHALALPLTINDGFLVTGPGPVEADRVAALDWVGDEFRIAGRGLFMLAPPHAAGPMSFDLASNVVIGFIEGHPELGLPSVVSEGAAANIFRGNLAFESVVTFPPLPSDFSGSFAASAPFTATGSLLLSGGGGESTPLTGLGTVDVILRVGDATGNLGSRTFILEAARFDFAPVPEPGTLLFVVSGAGAIGGIWLRRKRSV
jgi:hypothetical protein